MDLSGYGFIRIWIYQDRSCSIISQIHKGEMIIPETFSEGIRKGNVSLSSNSFMEQSFSQMVRISDIMLQSIFKHHSENY